MQRYAALRVQSRVLCLTTLNRLASYSSVPPGVTARKPSQCEDFCWRRPSSKRRVDRDELQRKYLQTNLTRRACSPTRDSTRETFLSPLRNSDSSIPGFAPSYNISSQNFEPFGNATPERETFLLRSFNKEICRRPVEITISQTTPSSGLEIWFRNQTGTIPISMGFNSLVLERCR